MTALRRAAAGVVSALGLMILSDGDALTSLALDMARLARRIRGPR